jgi:hypothetical protein
MMFFKLDYNTPVILTWTFQLKYLIQFSVLYKLYIGLKTGFEFSYNLSKQIKVYFLYV